MAHAILQPHPFFGDIANTFAVDLAEFYSTPPTPRRFILPGLLAGTVGALIAPGGHSKSMLSLQISHALASGTDPLELGLSSKPLPVWYLSAEDGNDILHERAHAIGKQLSAEQRALCVKNLIVVDSTAAIPNPDLTQTIWIDLLEEIAIGADLIFIDTLRSFHSGDENNSSQMAVLIGNIRSIASRTGCAIVFLHHTSKSSSMDGRGDMQQASRGSSVLVDNIRWQAFLAGMTKSEAERLGVDEEMRGFFVRFGISKQNYSAPIPDKWFRRVEGGLLVPAVLETATQSTHEGGRKHDEA